MGVATLVGKRDLRLAGAGAGDFLREHHLAGEQACGAGLVVGAEGRRVEAADGLVARRQIELQLGGDEGVAGPDMGVDVVAGEDAQLDDEFLAAAALVHDAGRHGDGIVVVGLAGVTLP